MLSSAMIATTRRAVMSTTKTMTTTLTRRGMSSTATSSSSSSSSKGGGPTILAMGVAAGLLALPFIAMEEEQLHPNSSTNQKLQRFKSQSVPTNPWGDVQYPDDDTKDIQHGHDLHVHMKDGPSKWHKGLQRWQTSDPPK